MCFVVLAAPRGHAEQNPVGGAIAGTGETLGIDKGLQPVNWVMVQSLPVGGYGSGDMAKQMGGKVRNLDPGQNEKPRVVGQEVAVALAGKRRPADEGVATVNGVRCRRKGHAGHHPAACGNQILEVFADRLAVAQVMVLPDQTVEKFFFRRPTNLSQFDRTKISEPAGNRRWAKIEGRRDVFSDPDLVVSTKPRRKSNNPFPFEFEEETTADTVFEVTVGLPPVPGLADPARDNAATLTPVSFYDLAEKGEIVPGNDSFAVGEYRVHEDHV